MIQFQVIRQFLATIFCMVTFLSLCLVNITDAKEISSSMAISKVTSVIQTFSTSGFREFQGSEIGDYAVFYDLDGNTSAYVYKINKNGEVLGYTVATSDSRFYPTFLTSNGTPPQDYLPVSALAQGTENNKVVSQKLIYLGTLDFFIEYTFEDGEVEYYDLRTAEKIACEYMDTLNQAYHKKAKELQQHHPNAYLQGDNPSKVEEGFVDPNPGDDHSGTNTYSFTWYRGCTTTSLSMLLSWYGRSDDNFYSNFDLNNYNIRHFKWEPDNKGKGEYKYCWIPGYPQWYDNINWTPKTPPDTPTTTAKDKEYLADQLADDMDILKGGEEDYWPWGDDYDATNLEMENAVQNVAKYNGYIFHADIHDPVDFNDIKTQIKHNKPFALGFGSNNTTKTGCFASNHETFAFGWRTSSLSGNEVWIYTTWPKDFIYTDQNNKPSKKTSVQLDNCVSSLDAIFVNAKSTPASGYQEDSYALNLGDVYNKTDVQIEDMAIHYYEFTLDSQIQDLTVSINGSGWGSGWMGTGYDPEYLVAKYDQSGNLILSFDHDGKVVERPQTSNGDWKHNWTYGPFANKNFSKIVVAVASSKNGGRYTLKVDPGKAKPNIVSPTESASDFVGELDDPSKTNIKVEVKTGNDTFLAGLTKDDFKVKIGGTNTQIVSLVERDDEYVLNVQPPTQAAEGLYDLEVTAFGETDTEMETVQYADTLQSNVDMVQVIDRSGSMGWWSYITDTKNAAKTFIDQMQTGDMVGVVSFSSSASVDYPLTEITGPTIETEAKNAIDAMYAGGYTSIGGGLRNGQAQLTNSGAATHPSAMVLLSDGYQNRSPSVSQVLPDILATKTKVFTIALGPKSDQALLQDIAAQTNGQYYLAPTSTELAGIYSNLSGQVANNQTMFSQTGAAQEGITDEKTVQIDPSVEEAQFSISWSGTGNDLDLTLKDPNGNIFDSNTMDSNVTFTSGTTSESDTISSPVPGEWTMQIFGGTVTTLAPEIPLSVLRDKANWISSYGDTAPDMKRLSSIYAAPLDAGLSYSATVTADTPLTVNTYLNKSSHALGDPILIRVIIADLQPVTGATVVGDVTAPFSTGSFSLYDDGLHGDAGANDGIYGNIFTKTKQVGTYSFDVQASGTTTGGDSFTRVGYASTYVSSADDADGDKMPDDWERNVNLDPTVDDSANDPDADKLTNIQEYQNGTDPFSDDTDSDDLTDGAEVNTHSTDPTKWDTDCGGESDGSEVANGRNPLDDPSDDVPSLEAVLQLNSNWNLVSLSVQPGNITISNVLNGISGKYSSAWAFQNNAWKVYDPANPGLSNLNTMEAGGGYWLNMTEATTLTVTGTVPSKSIDLISGWNLVGYNSSTGQDIADALVSISGKVKSVWAYVDGAWEVYDPANPGFSDLTTMNPGYGYWIKTTEACTWTLP